jgi:acetylornithine deacetylase/succinyl-diaminopimelate desuccinylase-like protein
MESFPLNEARFVDLLRKLVALGPRLQNAPDAGLVPEERLAADVVREALAPAVASGFVQIEALAAPGHEARPSLVLTVNGTGRGSVGFVGAHFDVVPADRVAEGWTRDPFALHVGDDGTLYGRGVTDCLGHVAVLTDLVAQLAERGARPAATLKVVLISNEEESPRPEIGLDYVVAAGKMDALRDGPVYWLDSADFGPTIGTAGAAGWELEVKGVPGHSGMPQNCVNALELAMATSLAMGEHFRRTFPPHAEEARYAFLSPSSLKATIVHATNNKVTKIPGDVKVLGDVRLTPFYEMPHATQSMTAFVAELDQRIERGDAPAGFPAVRTADGRRGSVALSFPGRGVEGIACKLDSPALAVLTEAIRHARPGQEVKPFSLTGSLPLVRDLQRRGFDVQITGFGRSGSYHAPNEQANLGHFREGFAILRELLARSARDRA